MLSNWQLDLIGDRDLQKQDEDEQEAVYNWYMLQLFAVGLVRNRKRGLQNVPDDLRSLVEAVTILPDAKNEYLMAVKRDGMKRVKTKLALDYRDGVLSHLRIMAREGHNPLYIARWLHNEYEGKAWYWNRLARSESTLALNASYEAWANQAGVLYDVWSTGGSRPCLICAALDGQMWKRGEGPSPVVDTHPHCFLSYTPVYTREGFKPIRDIKEGDYVLSHTGKYRKVIKKHKYKSKNQHLVRITYKKQLYNKKESKPIEIISTNNHPFLSNGKWVDAENIKPGDKIKLLATRCVNCNKLIPFSRWRDNNGEESKFCSQKCQTEKIFDKYGVGNIIFKQEEMKL